MNNPDELSPEEREQLISIARSSADNLRLGKSEKEVQQIGIVLEMLDPMLDTLFRIANELRIPAHLVIQTISAQAMAMELALQKVDEGFK